MAFDIKSAKPFDIKSAKPISEGKGFNIQTAKPAGTKKVGILGAAVEPIRKVYESGQMFQEPEKQKQIARSLGNVAYETINQPTFGLAGYGARKLGIPTPETTTAEAVAGGALSLPINLPARLVGKGIGTVAKNVKNVVQESKFVDNFSNAIIGGLKKSKIEFGAKLDELAKSNPDKVIDLSETVASLQHEASFSPKIQSLLRRIPILNNMVENPNLAQKLTVKEVQELKNLVNSSISPGKLKGRVSYTVEDLPLLELENKLADEQLKAFPEMEQVRQKYASKLKAYDAVKRTFGLNTPEQIPNKMLTKLNVKQKEALTELAGKKLLKDLTGFRRTKQLPKTALITAGATGSIGGIGWLASKALGK